MNYCVMVIYRQALVFVEFVCQWNNDY